MKFCANCNKSFDDDLNFCPECGEKLLSKDVCPKCGAAISEDDKFCPSCGFKLERQKVCPKCGEVLADDAQFCPKCGTRFEDKGFVVEKKSSPFNEDPEPREKKVKAPKQKKEKSFDLASKIVNISFACSTFLVILLILIGCFGSVYNQQSIAYFFGKGAENFKNLPEGGYKGFEIFLFTFENIFYFAGVVGFCFLATLSVMRNVKAIMHNRRADRKFFTLAMLAVFPYLAMIASRYTATIEITNANKQIVNFGWGTGMMYSAVVVGFSLLAIHSILSAIFEKGPIVSRSLLGAASMFLVILSIVSLSRVVTFDSNGIKGNFCSLSSIEQVIQNNGDGKGLAITGLVFAILSVIALFTAIYFLLIRRNSLLTLFAIGSGFVSGVIADAMVVASMNQCNMTDMYKFGGTSILLIIFSLVIAGLIVVNMILTKKRIVKEL